MLLKFNTWVWVEGGEMVDFDDHIIIYELKPGEELTNVTDGIVYTIGKDGSLCESKL